MEANLVRTFLCLTLSLFSLSLWAKPLIIFDAGSSGTRVYVYEVDKGVATQLSSLKLKPGLGSLDPYNTQALNQYFKTLLDSTVTYISEDTRATTPIYLYATAGIRMLTEPQQDAILGATLGSLTTQAQILGYPAPLAENVRTISGTEEGVFVWLSGNYLSGNLEQGHLSTKNTLVALEMGGASSEIAYLSGQAKDFTLPVEHGRKNYSVYAYGYDGLGADKALASMALSMTPGFDACFPVGAPYPLDNPTLIGTGNLEACVTSIKHEFVDPSELLVCHEQTPGHCSGLGVYQPRNYFTNRYLLTSAFYYLFNTLGLAEQPVAYSSFVKEAKGFCSMGWNEVLEINQPANTLINYCFNAALTKTLLDSWNVRKNDKLIAAATIDGTALEWPLGAALYLGQ